jgi:hypothetical protein
MSEQTKMSIIIIDASNGKVTVMPDTHSKSPGYGHDRDAALDRYREKEGSCNFEWMEFDGPLTLNFL